MKFLQANLHHAKGASDTFSDKFHYDNISIGLIQEPWVFQGKIRGLKYGNCKIIYDTSQSVPRTAIMVDPITNYIVLSKFCSRDLITIVVDVPISWGIREVICSSAYFHEDDLAPPALVQELITTQTKIL